MGVGAHRILSYDKEYSIKLSGNNCLFELLDKFDKTNSLDDGLWGAFIFEKNELMPMLAWLIDNAEKYDINEVIWTINDLMTMYEECTENDVEFISYYCF